MSAKSKNRWSFVAVLLFALTLVTFWSSFVALHDVAQRSGWPTMTAWCLPFMIDGAIVMTILSMVKAKTRGNGTGFAMFVFIFSTGMSMFLNGMHAFVAYDSSQGLARAVTVIVGMLPPVLLLMLTKLFESEIESESERAAPVEVAAEVAEAAALPEAVVVELGEARRQEVPAVTAQAVIEQEDTPAPAEPTEMDEQVVTEAPVIADVPESVMDVVVTEPGVMTAAVEPAVTELTEATDPAPALHAVVNIPADPAGQIDWIVARARSGSDVTKKALLQVFEEAGQAVSDSTAQRRLREAREKAPEAFAA